MNNQLINNFYIDFGKFSHLENNLRFFRHDFKLIKTIFSVIIVAILGFFIIPIR